MLHEYRDLIAHLRQTDHHFSKIFDKHNELDQEIHRLESDLVSASRFSEIDLKKKKKLMLKDEIYQILRKKEKEANL